MTILGILLLFYIVMAIAVTFGGIITAWSDPNIIFKWTDIFWWIGFGLIWPVGFFLK